MRSVQAISKRVCLDGDEATFVQIGKMVLRAKSKEEILNLLSILSGKTPISEIGLTADQTHWGMSENWVSWWSHEDILSMEIS